MKNKTWIGWVLAFALLFGLQAGLCAQAGHGRGFLTGVVQDVNGKPLANVTVTLEFTSGGFKEQFVTKENGEWKFIGLGTGMFTLSAEGPGMLKTVKQVEVSQLRQNRSVTVEMKEDPSKAVRLKDEADQQLVEQGNTLFGEKKYQEAIDVFNQFALKNPGIYMIYFNIGDCQREMQNYDEAIKQYTIALDKAKQNSDVVMQAKGYALIGEVFLRQEKFKEAQENFTQSIALNPKDEVLAYNVAEIFFGRNQTDKAIEYYKLAIQIKPEWSEPYLKIGYAYLNKGDMKLAIEALNEFLVRDPESPQAPVVKSLIESLSKVK